MHFCRPPQEQRCSTTTAIFMEVDRRLHCRAEKWAATGNCRARINSTQHHFVRTLLCFLSSGCLFCALVTQVSTCMACSFSKALSKTPYYYAEVCMLAKMLGWRIPSEWGKPSQSTVIEIFRILSNQQTFHMHLDSYLNCLLLSTFLLTGCE